MSEMKRVLKNACIVKDAFFDNIFSKHTERSLSMLETCYDWVQWSTVLITNSCKRWESLGMTYLLNNVRQTPALWVFILALQFPDINTRNKRLCSDESLHQNLHWDARASDCLNIGLTIMESMAKKIDHHNWNSFKLKLVKVCME